MKKLLLLMLFMMAGLRVPLSAADLTGDWELELNPDFGGVDDVVACTFQQDGDKLSVNCGGGPEILGTVHGQTVSFVVKTGPKREYAATFSGELDQNATTIVGVWALTDQNGKREGRFTLRLKRKL